MWLQPGKRRPKSRFAKPLHRSSSWRLPFGNRKVLLSVVRVGCQEHKSPRLSALRRQNMNGASPGFRPVTDGLWTGRPPWRGGRNPAGWSVLHQPSQCPPFYQKRTPRVKGFQAAERPFGPHSRASRLVPHYLPTRDGTQALPGPPASPGICPPAWAACPPLLTWHGSPAGHTPPTPYHPPVSSAIASGNR